VQGLIGSDFGGNCDTVKGPHTQIHHNIINILLLTLVGLDKLYTVTSDCVATAKGTSDILDYRLVVGKRFPN
jgi:hypothetical protein